MSSRSLPECEQDFLLDVLDSHGTIQTIKSYAAFGECSLSLKSEMLSDNGERPYFPRQEIMTDKIKARSSGVDWKLEWSLRAKAAD